MPKDRTKSLTDLVLTAAIEIVGGDLSKDFAAEHLLVQVWEHEKEAFGLRGFEQDHPDANRLYTKLDGKLGLVAKGYLEKAGERRFRLTRAGLDLALKAQDVPDTGLQTKLDRQLQEDIAALVSHEEFRKWLGDPTSPSRFRGAGHFWNIAPGTPPRVVHQRVREVDRVLDEADRALDAGGEDTIASQRGKRLFDRNDIARCREFQRVLKERFAKELQTLDPEHRETYR